MLFAASLALGCTGNASYAMAELDASARSSELECLALNIYWEARSEPIEGQLGVAHVTLNRVADPDYPDSVCDVVFQGVETRRGQCQFSWWCDGRSDKPTEPRAWETSLERALEVLKGKSDDPTGGALYFHRDKNSPRWSVKKQRTARIGKHLYYK